MVFLFFTSAFLFFKTYGFPFSGSLVLCLTLAISQFHSAKSLKPGPYFLFFPAALSLLSLWDGSPPEDILDLVTISLAGILSGGGFSFLGSRSPAFKEAVGLLLFASSCVLSYARQDISPFLIPVLAILLTPSLPKKIRISLLTFACVGACLWLLLHSPSSILEPSITKSVILYLGIIWVLLTGAVERISKLLFFVFFLLISFTHPGKEFAIFSLGLFFSYLQEGGWGLESGREI